MSSKHRLRSSARRAVNIGVEGLESRALLSVAPLSGRPFAPFHSAAEIGGSHGGAARHRVKNHIHHDLGGRLQGPAASLGVTVRPMAGHGAQPQATPASAPYTPGQIRHAYGFDQLGLDGSGQTIAIVDAYDDPTIASDLHVFDQAFGLPDPEFVKYVPTSGTPQYNAGWAGEIALDVEWAHAIAPGAQIVLIEARSSSLTDLLSAVDFATSLGANQISMSWGGPAFSRMSNYDYHFNHPGVTYLAAAGDSGAGAEFPSASPYVTSVGGTSLQLDTDGNRLSETAWSSGGGGTTSFEAKPSYQVGFLGGRKRGTPDVAYNADPGTGFLVYDSSSGGAWWQVGGTSAGVPQWAGLVALANEGRALAGNSSLGTGLTYGTNQVLYAMAGGSGYSNPDGDYFDVTSGSNGYSATTGYDLATGLGSPVANRLVPSLINA